MVAESGAPLPLTSVRSNVDMRDPSSPTCGVMLSGGIDSAVLLVELLRQSRRVVPFYVKTGCVWQDCELAAMERFLAKVRCRSLARLVVLEMPVTDLYQGHWSVTGNGPPDRFTTDEAVFMPGRNPLLLVKPALWCQMHGVRKLAIATLAANPFDDATPAFFSSFSTMVQEATGDGVEILRPLETMSKREVLSLGRDLPLELTFSCISPARGLHCGQCNKCAERQMGFRELGVRDRTRYASPAASVAG